MTTIAKSGFKIVAIEGMDCSGKSTLIKALKEQRWDVEFSREPGGTALGDEIRKLILSPKHQSSSRTNSLLFLANRSDQIDKIKNHQKTIILDRFHLSTIVYQHLLGGVELELLTNIHKHLMRDLPPITTFVLKISKKEFQERMEKRRSLNVCDKFEHFTFEDLDAAYEEAIKILEKTGDKFTILNSDLKSSIEAIKSGVMGDDDHDRRHVDHHAAPLLSHRKE